MVQRVGGVFVSFMYWLLLRGAVWCWHCLHCSLSAAAPHGKRLMMIRKRAKIVARPEPREAVPPPIIEISSGSSFARAPSNRRGLTCPRSHWESALPIAIKGPYAFSSIQSSKPFRRPAVSCTNIDLSGLIFRRSSTSTKWKKKQNYFRMSN